MCFAELFIFWVGNGNNDDFLRRKRGESNLNSTNVPSITTNVPIADIYLSINALQIVRNRVIQRIFEKTIANYFAKTSFLAIC